MPSGVYPRAPETFERMSAAQTEWRRAALEREAQEWAGIDEVVPGLLRQDAPRFIALVRTVRNAWTDMATGASIRATVAAKNRPLTRRAMRKRAAAEAAAKLAHDAA